MGFYLITNSSRKYISESYLRNTLLRGDADKVENIKTVADNEELLFKKLNVKIPEIRMNDILKKFAEQFKKNNIDDYSVILSFDRAHLLAIFYLFNEGKIGDAELRKLLFSSSFKTRNDLLLSYLHGSTDTEIDIFKTLTNYLKKMANYKNPGELKDRGRSVENIKNSLKTGYFKETTLQHINVGNFFYAKLFGNSQIKNLLKNCNSLSDATLNTDPGRKWRDALNHLPVDTTALNLVNGTLSEIHVAEQRLALGWWEMIGYLSLYYGAFFKAILTFIRIFAPSLVRVLPLILALIGAVLMDDAKASIKTLGLLRYIGNNDLYRRYTQSSRYLRLGDIKNDIAARLLFTMSYQDFNNRLLGPILEYSLPDISELARTSLGELWRDQPFYPEPSERGKRESKKYFSLNWSDWYDGVYKVVTPASGNGLSAQIFSTNGQSGTNRNKNTFSGAFIQSSANDLDGVTPDLINNSDRNTLLSHSGIGMWVNSINGDDLNNDYLIATLAGTIRVNTSMSYLFGGLRGGVINNYHPSENLDYILGNDILIDSYKTSVRLPSGRTTINGKEIAGAPIVNFGTTNLNGVIEKIINKLNEKNLNRDDGGIRNFEDLLDVNKVNSVLDSLKFYMEDDKNFSSMKSNSLTNTELNLFPLARSIVYRYILWLKDDGFSEKDISYTTYVPLWYFRYYKALFFIRHTYFNFSTMLTKLTSNTTLQLLYGDMFGNRTALTALFNYIQSKQNSLFTRVFTSSDVRSLSLINNMFSSNIKLRV